jgi:hypothetical protein
MRLKRDYRENFKLTGWIESSWRCFVDNDDKIFQLQNGITLRTNAIWTRCIGVIITFSYFTALHLQYDADLDFCAKYF